MLSELQTLTSQYARSRETLFKAVEGLTDAQLREPFPGRDWSIHDTMVHLAANEGLMTALLLDIAHGTRTAVPPDFDNEKFNAASVAAGRAKSEAQVRADLDASYAHMLEVLESIKSDELECRGTHPAAGDADVKEFYLAMYAHHEVHCRDIIEQARRLRRMGS